MIEFGDPRLPQRFWNKVRVADSGCWEWTGSLDTRGYGSFWWSPAQTIKRAHRIAYAQLVGPIADGLVSDHLCRNPPCVNPAHLEMVTFKENILRGDSFTAENARKTACPRGHPLQPLSRIQPFRGRGCLLCLRKRKREEARKKRQDPEWRARFNAYKREWRRGRKHNTA